MTKSIQILLVEDNPADVELTQIALAKGKLSNSLNVCSDGEEALNYLRKKEGFEHAERPDLILLDLNLPKIDGREVLAEIKSDENLSSIPVVILSSSEAASDIKKAYQLNANCFVTKPIAFEGFMKTVLSVQEFWINIVTLPNES